MLVIFNIIYWKAIQVRVVRIQIRDVKIQVRVVRDQIRAKRHVYFLVLKLSSKPAAIILIRAK